MRYLLAAVILIAAVATIIVLGAIIAEAQYKFQCSWHSLETHPKYGRKFYRIEEKIKTIGNVLGIVLVYSIIILVLIMVYIEILSRIS